MIRELKVHNLFSCLSRLLTTDHIYIVSDLFTSRDNQLENLGENMVLACKNKVHFWFMWVKNFTCLSSLLLLYLHDWHLDIPFTIYLNNKTWLRTLTSNNSTLTCKAKSLRKTLLPHFRQTCIIHCIGKYKRSIRTKSKSSDCVCMSWHFVQNIIFPKIPHLSRGK